MGMSNDPRPHSDGAPGPGDAPSGGPPPGHDGDKPKHPFTLAVDIGGTGLKASVLDADGLMVADRVRVPTLYPLPPRSWCRI